MEHDGILKAITLKLEILSKFHGLSYNTSLRSTTPIRTRTQRHTKFIKLQNTDTIYIYNFKKIYNL